MRLALQTDYSLRTLMLLAARPERQTVAGVATFFQISQTHVAKVVNQLVRLGYIRSIRGIGGGLELARSSESITIGEVIQAVEGQVHLLECIGIENVCVIQQHCKLRTVLTRAEQVQREYLNSVRLCDVLPSGLPVSATEPGPSAAKAFEATESLSRKPPGRPRGKRPGKLPKQ